MSAELRSTARPTPLRLWGFLLTAAGALVLGIGCTLDWAVLGFPGDTGGALDVPVKGIDVWEGVASLAAAILALVGTLGLRFLRGVDARRALALAVVTLGALAMALAISVAMRPDARFAGDEALDQVASSLAGALDIPVEEAKTQLLDELDLALEVTLGPGVWLTMAGGLLIVVGGSLTLAWAKRPDPTRPEATEEPGPPAQPGVTRRAQRAE